ncbi:MAG: hypothetical protein IPJ03_17280 [Ignavibacteriales bacterium]|nr:hypothetical protein [Ignavibacteriales bacterium]
MLVVDPVYDVNDKFNYDKLGFLRGFVKHYKHTGKQSSDIQLLRKLSFKFTKFAFVL